MSKEASKKGNKTTPQQRPVKELPQGPAPVAAPVEPKFILEQKDLQDFVVTLERACANQFLKEAVFNHLNKILSPLAPPAVPEGK